MKLYQVDAFTGRMFHGNPAAVVPLEVWPPEDSFMRAIAAENNLSETAFIVPRSAGEEDYAIRWFTPTEEVDLCGHATLASAHVLWTELGFESDSIVFASRSGPLTVSRRDGLLELDFPESSLEPAGVSTPLVRALGRQPAEAYRGKDLLCVFDNKRDVHELEPDFAALARVEGVRGVICTAPGASHDYVCRFFGPAVGVNEDPATGSAQCMLAPYWSKRLGKTTLAAHQVSARGGEMTCRVNDPAGRVKIAGHAVTYLKGEICL